MDLKFKCYLIENVTTPNVLRKKDCKTHVQAIVSNKILGKRC